MQPITPFDATLYAPLSETAPCGPALERHEFVALSKACTETEGAYNFLEDREGDPIPPNYGEARPIAFDLLKRSRDLRPMARLVVIESHVNGPHGLHAALDYITAMLTDHWPALHPGEAADGNMHAQRRQALDPLRDKRKIVQGLEGTVLFEVAGFGEAVTLHDVLLASGKRVPRDGATLQQLADLSLKAKDAGALQSVKQMADALTASAERLRVISQLLADRLERAPTLDPVATEIDELADCLGQIAANDSNPQQTPATARGQRPDVPSANDQATQIVSPEDAANLLTEVLRFYAETAPSSPVALILLKLRGLSSSSFSDWVSETGGGPEKAALSLQNVDTSVLSEIVSGDSDDAAGEVSGTDPVFNGIVDAADALEASLCAALSESKNLKKTADINQSKEKNPPDLEDLLRQMHQNIQHLRDQIRATKQNFAESPEILTSRKRIVRKITDRNSVKSALDRLAAFYEGQDPSNPNSTILRRTKRLVEMNYLDIIKELAPSGGTPALRLMPPEDKK